MIDVIASIMFLSVRDIGKNPNTNGYLTTLRKLMTSLSGK